MHIRNPRWTTVFNAPGQPRTSRRKALGHAALAGTLALAALPASASFTVYTDPTSFLAATGAVQSTNFNGYTADVSANNLDFGAFTARGHFTLDAPSQTYYTDGSTNLHLNTDYGGWGDFQFDQGLMAFGAWFAGINPTNRPYSLISVDANSLAGYGSYSHVGEYLPPTTAGGTLRFIGFTSTQAFNRIVFEGAGCCMSSYAMDNVVYSAALAPVPEPETYAMLLAGLGLMGAVVRRRSAKAAV
ncbi:PEP-CTERM sorting domain-containing protein [Rhodoferax sp. TH121]|uniref:PEP-CTERM sorting domain-containing protein n=1 Tax=Rhodoferax sp. TH121 TaxID=2022803 RepID=UPI0020CE54FA|nr:PEP-CTERM sorting domain-containing protein [Rhodoferax sp. TH121]